MSTDALDKYCYIAPLKQALLAKFLSEFGLTNVQYSNNQFVHHKDRASFRTFHNLNFVKYSESLKEFLEIPLQDTDSVFNVMTAVIDPSKDVLNIKEVGEVMYTEFLEKRRTGTDVSVRDTMHKRKLLTFKTSARVIEMKLKSDKIFTLKAERSLMTKLLVITRSRPEIDVAELFSIHEFSAVPRSLFDQYGLQNPYSRVVYTSYGNRLECLSVSVLPDPSRNSTYLYIGEELHTDQKVIEGQQKTRVC